MRATPDPAFAMLPAQPHGRTLPRSAATTFALLLLLVKPPAAGAQAHSTLDVRACRDSLPASALTRVPIYLEAEVTDSADRAILPSADTLVIRVAQLIRTSLAEPGTSLPEADLLIPGRRLGGNLRVVAHRAGGFTWSPALGWAGEDTLDAPSRHLLVQALTALRQGGVRLGWPAGVQAESLTFDLEYRWSDISEGGKVHPLTARHAVPVFSMAMPWVRPVVLRRRPHISYPSGSQTRGVQGTVVLQFVVDTAGRVEQDTIEERWPADRPRLTGELAEHYQAFLTAAKRSLAATRYHPARIGGCVVRQFVQQPFQFNLRR